MAFSARITNYMTCGKCGEFGTVNEPVILLYNLGAVEKGDNLINIHPSCFAAIVAELAVKPKA